MAKRNLTIPFMSNQSSNMILLLKRRICKNIQNRQKDRLSMKSLKKRHMKVVKDLPVLQIWNANIAQTSKWQNQKRTCLLLHNQNCLMQSMQITKRGLIHPKQELVGTLDRTWVELGHLDQVLIRRTQNKFIIWCQSRHPENGSRKMAMKLKKKMKKNKSLIKSPTKDLLPSKKLTMRRKKEKSMRRYWLPSTVLSQTRNRNNIWSTSLKSHLLCHKKPKR